MLEEVKTKLEGSIPLNVKPIPENSKHKTWAEFNFKQMPVAAILPLLSKFQNDARVSETAVLNYFLGKTEGEEMKPDAFEAVIAADKSYVIKGEDLSAEIFLGAYSSTADNIAVRVNGRSVPVRETIVRKSCITAIIIRRMIIRSIFYCSDISISEIS